MEKFELVDDKGNRTSKILSIVELENVNNIPKDCYLPVTGVVILNTNNNILAQKRSKLKSTNPGKWGIFSGKVDLGENFKDAAVREVYEEIGVKLNKEELKILSKYKDNKAFFIIFYIYKNIDITDCKLQKQEIDEIKYFNIKELENLYNDGFEWLPDLKKLLQIK